MDLPNDEFFGHLWGLDNVGQYIGGSRTNGVGTADVDVDAPEAWAITMGDPEVVVGVIDTAIDVGHPDLAANVWTNPGEIAGDGVDNDHNGFVDDVHGWNFYDGTARTWTPGEGYHGTHVAGTIAALAGNGVGVAGVAPNVRIVQLQFLGPEGYGYTSDAVEALSYARTMGVRLTSNSWGGGGFDLELHDAICSSDGIFVAAAGNNSANADTSPLYPAAYDCPNIVSVAALTNTGALASFSNYGPTTVDVGAPGQDVLSTLPAGEYGFLSGTSMATPHVSGIAALMLSMQPGLGGAQVRELLIQTVKPLESLRGVTVSGGMASAVNAVHALELVTDPKDRAIEVPADKIITVTYIADVQAGTAFEAISLLRGDAPVAVTRTLAGKILQLVPVAPLAIDGIYTVIIPEGAVLDATGRALRAYSFSFKTHDTLPPAVVRTDPQDGGANAPGSQTITITLDEDVKAGGAFANVTLTTGGTAVPVSTSTDRNVFTIDPVYSLAKSSTYTVTAPAGALTDLSGNPLAAFTFSFSTALDVTPPRVVSCEPPPYSVEVPTTGDVVFDYTKNITLGAGATGISLGCLGEPGVFVSSTSANVLFLHPVRPLESSSLCLAWIPPGAVQDEFGNTNLEPNGVYFWTRDDRSPLRTSTNPADGATGVPAASAITASFDEDIVPGSSFDAITLKDEAGMSVPFSWSYPDDGYGFTYSNMLAFTPQDVLGSLRRYTLTVPAGAITDLSAQRNPAAGFQILVHDRAGRRAAAGDRDRSGHECHRGADRQDHLGELQREGRPREHLRVHRPEEGHRRRSGVAHAERLPAPRLPCGPAADRRHLHAQCPRRGRGGPRREHPGCGLHAHLLDAGHAPAAGDRERARAGRDRRRGGQLHQDHAERGFLPGPGLRRVDAPGSDGERHPRDQRVLRGRGGDNQHLPHRHAGGADEPELGLHARPSGGCGGRWAGESLGARHPVVQHAVSGRRVRSCGRRDRRAAGQGHHPLLARPGHDGTELRRDRAQEGDHDRGRHRDPQRSAADRSAVGSPRRECQLHARRAGGCRGQQRRATARAVHVGLQDVRPGRAAGRVDGSAERRGRGVDRSCRHGHVQREHGAGARVRGDHREGRERDVGADHHGLPVRRGGLFR